MDQVFHVGLFTFTLKDIRGVFEKEGFILLKNGMRIQISKDSISGFKKAFAVAAKEVVDNYQIENAR